MCILVTVAFTVIKLCPAGQGNDYELDDLKLILVDDNNESYESDVSLPGGVTRVCIPYLPKGFAWRTTVFSDAPAAASGHIKTVQLNYSDMTRANFQISPLSGSDSAVHFGERIQLSGLAAVTPLNLTPCEFVSWGNRHNHVCLRVEIHNSSYKYRDIPLRAGFQELDGEVVMGEGVIYEHSGKTYCGEYNRVPASSSVVVLVDTGLESIGEVPIVRQYLLYMDEEIDGEADNRVLSVIAP